VDWSIRRLPLQEPCTLTSLREKLKQGGCVIGSWVNSTSPIVTELMASMGFDFLTIDAEHSVVDLAQTQQLLQAVRSGNPDCAGLVRLPGSTYDLTKQFMDTGAEGVIAPLINSPEQAKELVGAVKYPPDGLRGVGFCRANYYGTQFDRFVPATNQWSLVGVQIEHIDAVRNIDAILSTPGIDAAFIGPYDLSASMGIVGQFDHPRMAEAMDQILAACHRYNVAGGVHVVQPNPDEVKRRFDEGYRMIAYSLDITMLADACRTGLEAIREFIPR
jgi:2-dehydro-3-deoxyglucarate aldolase